MVKAGAIPVLATWGQQNKQKTQQVSKDYWQFTHDLSELSFLLKTTSQIQLEIRSMRVVKIN